MVGSYILQAQKSYFAGEGDSLVISHELHLFRVKAGQKVRLRNVQSQTCISIWIKVGQISTPDQELCKWSSILLGIRKRNAHSIPIPNEAERESEAVLQSNRQILGSSPFSWLQVTFLEDRIEQVTISEGFYSF